MTYKSIPFLGLDIPLPLRFAAMLPFSNEDKRDMPWLVADTRYYGIEKELGKGGRAVAFKGFVSDKHGNRLPKTPDIVLKVPNFNTDLYLLAQIKEYLGRQSEEGGREWQLTRGRLHGCEYANPIFDFSVVTQVGYLGELMPLPVTAQLFLQKATSLDDYLLNTKQRQEPYMSKQGVPVHNWNGMSNPAKWIELAQGIATGLADIHRRRVVHGDIWPPNIFIKLDENGKPIPVFIDFGESFPIEPMGEPKEQRDHAYRAPERKDAQSIVNQQVDVYSFGKLLLHLAIGEEPILSSKYQGHERRDIVRQKFAHRNPNLANDNPFIMDIICKCISLDPIERPSISELLRALNSYVDTEPKSMRMHNVPDRLDDLRRTWDQVNSDLSARGTGVSPFLEELVEQRLDEIQWMIKGLSNEVINLRDTRERLILALIGLFRRLGDGDRFLSLTSPQLWRGPALGLDGRYFTATALAAGRKASVQRVFVFSIQEVGDRWANDLALSLEHLSDRNRNAAASKLAKSLRIEISKYIAARQQGETRDLPEDLQIDARQRLTLVIKSYLDASRSICQNAFDQFDEFRSSADNKGIYVGLMPVSTLRVSRTLKAAHPVSIFFYSSAEERDRYLLMMTDCLGRNSFGGNEDYAYNDIAFLRSMPELRGITVFKSVLGVPEDRIKKLEQVFKQSIGIGRWIGDLYDIVSPESPT